MTDTVPASDLRRLENIREGEVARGRQRTPAMAADVMSPRSEPASIGTSSPTVNRTSLPPLLTSPPSKAKLERASSYISKRLSTFSNASNTQGGARSRPQSTAFPIFHSSLPYSLVRDFAYGPLHPLFYGPLPEQPSDISTPASEVSRRLSDPPPPVPWNTDRGGWSASSRDPGEQLPQTSFADGPPYVEDEDIHSPVVVSHPRGHKKHKSNIVDFDNTRGRRGYTEEQRRAPFNSNGESSNTYNGESYHGDDPNDPTGSDYITYPPRTQGQSGQGLQVPRGEPSRRDSHFAATLPRRTYAENDGPPYDSDEEMSEPGDFQDTSRFSRDYQFTIASPAEEMHGRAVALFDFARENDNELPLVEGQVILVSYRHGQGWLVAEDPRTGESGLVPEEYVRLLRDIEGGFHGLMNGIINSDNSNNNTTNNEHDGLLSPVSAPEAKTPTQADHRAYTPVISTFSTSTKDLEPYPKEMLGTPTATEGQGFSKLRESSKDRAGSKEKSESTPMEGVQASPEPTSQPSKQS